MNSIWEPEKTDENGLTWKMYEPVELSTEWDRGTLKFEGVKVITCKGPRLENNKYFFRKVQYFKCWKRVRGNHKLTFFERLLSIPEDDYYWERDWEEETQKAELHCDMIRKEYEMLCQYNKEVTQ